MPAPKYEDNILGFIPQEEWLDMGFEVTRPNDPIDELFTDDKTDNITARWESIASEYQIPVMAQFHGFDTEAQTTFRIPIDNHNIEKGLIKVKINQSERMRTLMRAGVRNDEMYDYVLNDGVRLADQVVTRTKVAKNELMATGVVTIHENNLNLTVDYGVPEAHKAFILDFSADADMDIPSQIQAIVDYAAEKGITLNGMMTSKRNITMLRKNADIQKEINGSAAVGTLIRRSALEGYLEEEFGISRIVVSDLTYGESAVIGEDGRPIITQKRYFPKDKITFFATNPGGRLGIGLWGNPPEVDAGQFMKVNASGQSPYVYISQWMEKDPAVLWTKASGLFMPVLYNPNSLFIVTVESDNSYLGDLTVASETDSFGVLYDGKKASDLQTGVTVSDGKISGTLKFIEGGLDPSGTGPLSGDGYFLALKWSGLDPNTTSLKVGLDPSQGTGMIECFADPDRNGVFKITNKNTQKLKIVQSDSHGRINSQTFSLKDLVLQPAGA